MFLIGDGCMLFQPPPDDEPSARALSALAHALMELNQVAIVRKVYRANSTPRLGALIPEEKTDEDGNKYMSLVFIELPYMEDRRDYQFASLANENPDEGQLEAVDQLIDSMMMDDEDLEPENVLNPYNQHLYRLI